MFEKYFKLVSKAFYRLELTRTMYVTPSCLEIAYLKQRKQDLRG